MPVSPFYNVPEGHAHLNNYNVGNPLRNGAFGAFFDVNT